MNRAAILLLVLGLAALAPAEAAVDLVTLPDRDYLQLTIYNNEDLTLVRERRVLTMKRGVNRIQFEWHGTLIDPSSVFVMPITHSDEVTVLHTSYPPNRPGTCIWSIESRREGPVLMEIRYFTSGITWKADYALFANEDESEMTLRGFVKVVNKSGEEYPNAQVRVVVGNVNLVEKIALLAQQGHPRMRRDQALGRALREHEAGDMEEKAMPSAAGVNGKDFGFKQAKKVRKEGLSEYFIFTIEGRETVLNGWSKRLRAVTSEGVDLTLLYRLSEKTTGGQLRKLYKFHNRNADEERGTDGLGESPLPDGGVRAFRLLTDGSLEYAGGTATKYIPRGEKVELDLGTDPDVTAKRILKDYRRSDIVLNEHGHVISYREHFLYETTIDNARDRVIEVEMERVFGGDFELHDLRGAERFEKVDERTAKYYADLGPGEKRTVTYRVEVFHPDRK